MSEAPERIWVDGQDYWANPTYKDDKTEYVRADMLHEIFLRYSKAETARIKELEAERDEALNQLDSARHTVDVLVKRLTDKLTMLAKAVEALTAWKSAGDDSAYYEAVQKRNATLAELKGEDRG
jgi:hypothetical protein